MTNSKASHESSTARHCVAACQFEPTVGDVSANITRIEQIVENLAPATAFAVFPELCVSGYDLDAVPDASTTVPGPMTDRLRDIARQSGIDLVVGLPEAVGDDVFNSLVYVSDQGVLEVYRKQELWGEEATRLAAGSGPTTVDTSVGRLGLMLCYDLNFPELALEYGAAECDLIAVSAAWRRSFNRDWQLLCRARALDQTCYVIGSNHTGSQTGRKHAGESLIAGPRGDVIAKTTDGSTTASVRIAPTAIETAREKNPVQSSRRSRRDGSSS
jgi:predicted amidohydrolase